MEVLHRPITAKHLTKMVPNLFHSKYLIAPVLTKAWTPGLISKRSSVSRMRLILLPLRSSNIELSKISFRQKDKVSWAIFQINISLFRKVTHLCKVIGNKITLTSIQLMIRSSYNKNWEMRRSWYNQE